MSRARPKGDGSASFAPLFKTKGQLEARSKFVSDELAKLLETPLTSLQVHTEFASESAVAELQGGATEPTQGRNRGRGTQVVKLCDFGHAGPAWLGLREKWNYAEHRGGRAYYAFESACITVYAGDVGLLEKAQILRAEWAGFADRGGGVSFQAGEAGHPHWQVDLFETLRGTDEEVARFGDLPAIRPFSSQSTAIGLKAKLLSAPFERFHFASAARWWLPDGEGLTRHQHTPRDDDDVSRWVFGSIGYVREQLRVVARGIT